MEPQTASVYHSGSVPRLRVTRRPSSTASSGLPLAEWPPDFQASLSYPDSHTPSENELGPLGPAGATPRFLSSVPPPDGTAESGVGHRLRAVLDRFDNSFGTSANAYRGAMPPSPSEPESDIDLPPARAARASIKKLFQNALREPGDTPQKLKVVRRASFNSVGSPKVSKSRRKSTSDDEHEILAKRHDGRSDISTAESLDRLRLQLHESMSSKHAASSSGSISQPPSDSTVLTPKKATSSHHPFLSNIPIDNSPLKQPKSHQDLEPFVAISGETKSSIGLVSPGAWPTPPAPGTSPLRSPKHLLTPSTINTPRIPGAFRTTTPSPSPVVVHSVEENISDLDDIKTTPKLEPVDTAKPSEVLVDDHSAAKASLLPVTPAPPGAYRPTPTASKRKGILKVRFDGDLQKAGLVNSTGIDMNSFVPTMKTTPLLSPPSPSSEDVPLPCLSPCRRKGLRLVDEYGRARRFTEDGKEIILDQRRKGATEGEPPRHTSPPKSLPLEDVTMTPWRRKKMRQVDELGNEIIEGPKPANSEHVETRVRRNAVFSGLARSLEELNHELAMQEEVLAASMPQRGPRDDERLMDLAVVSKSARVERSKLARKLQLERHAEGGISDSVYSIQDSALLSWWRRKWRLTICIIILEFFFLCVGYRLASVHAKQAWLATHYDPFFPALYLRKTPPSFISRFGSLPVGWSAFAISGAVRRVGVRGFVEGIWKQLWEGIWNCRLEPWETWNLSPQARLSVPKAWPPS